MPTAVFDTPDLSGPDHTINFSSPEMQDLTYLFHSQHRRILPQFVRNILLSALLAIKKLRSLRRKRKQISVDVSYSVFKILSRPDRTAYIVCRLFLCPKIDVLLAAPTPRNRSSRRHISRHSKQGGVCEAPLAISDERILPTAFQLSSCSMRGRIPSFFS